MRAEIHFTKEYVIYISILCMRKYVSSTWTNSAALNPGLWRRPYFCGVSDVETADKNDGQVPHAEELPMLRYCLGYNHTNL